MSDEDTRQGMLSSVLSYVDSPFKLGAIVVMGVLSFAGYLVYANQALLIDAYRRDAELPKLDVAAAEDSIPLLMRETGADIVALFSVNQIRGTRTVERIYTQDGRDKTHDQRVLKLFTGVAENDADVIALMSGDTPCGEYGRAQSIVGLTYKQRGVTYTCRISLPPEKDSFVGQYTLGWTAKPSDLEHIRAVMQIASQNSVKR
jgi:hypothetical protein